jgi:hypothetical protein
LPWDRDIPRACNDPKYPDSYWAGGTMDYLFTAMKEKDPPHFKECNETIKAFAKKNGYTFIDFYETDLVDKDGYRKPQYTHYMDVGEILSRSGFKIYGDHIMDKMGLPRAK